MHKSKPVFVGSLSSLLLMIIFYHYCLSTAGTFLLEVMILEVTLLHNIYEKHFYQAFI
jgi:hypothetical protein